MPQKNFTKYANSFQAVARLGLESIRCMMKTLGNPQNDLKFIHVAGTNGKGSVCSFLQSIFTAAGFKTGKYISPNLISVCERISIDGIDISEAAINNLMSIAEEGAKKVEQETGSSPTQFEIWTAAAFCYFKEQQCDIVILETGLGGEQDATNIIPPPLASVITKIDFDHTDYLGNTLREIASAKAGIIKKHELSGTKGLTVSAVQEKAAKEVIEEKCIVCDNALVFVENPDIKSFSDYREIFDTKTIKNITCGIPGYHQPENAALAIETALRLGIDEKYIKSGVEKASNPARFEIIQKNPPVIYDGAHNKNGMQALIKSLKRYFPDWCGATFIVAFMGDKDISGTLCELKNSGLCENSEFFTVKVKNNPRAAEAQAIAQKAHEYELCAKAFESLENSYKAALSKEKPVILCGSLYLYKDFAEIEKL